MVQRTRTRTLATVTGNRYYIGNNGPELPGTVVNSPSIYQRCVDNVAPGNGHNFDSTYRYQRRDGGLVNRKVNKPGLSFANWRLDALQGCSDSTVWGHLAISGRPTDAVLATKLLAETNPSRPVVDLPLFVYELKEIPELLRKEGGHWLRRIASHNLQYQFGWKLLIQDLQRLVLFQDFVHGRMKELESLQKSGLRRKRQLWSGSNTGTAVRWLQSNGFSTGNVNLPKATTQRVWGHVVWYPDEVGPTNLTDLRSRARSAVLGLTVDPSTAWNALPWSWLVDWCANVGDYLAAKRNIVGAHPSEVLIMDTRSTTISWQYSHPNVSPWSGGTISKSRRRATPDIDASLPWLSPRQLSILGSIGVTRRLPGYTK